MELSSLHTHTIFCDGADGIETMCKAAHQKGLASIGFSSHAPIFRKTGMKTDWHMDDARLNQYIDEVSAARSRWEGKLNVFLGLEIDYIKGCSSARDSDILSLGLDYTISSVHYVIPDNGTQPFTIDGPLEEIEQGIAKGFGGDGEALMHAYWDALAGMIAIGGFDILGHADLIRKNNGNNRFFSTESPDWHCRQAEIAHAAGCGKCAAEVNTGGLNRGRYTDVYPSVGFLREFRKNQVPALITADAHCAADLDGHYDTARQALRDSGYSEHMLFKGKIAGQAIWDNVKL